MPITAEQLEAIATGFHAEAEKHFQADSDGYVGAHFDGLSGAHLRDGFNGAHPLALMCDTPRSA